MDPGEAVVLFGVVIASLLCISGLMVCCYVFLLSTWSTNASSSDWHCLVLRRQVRQHLQRGQCLPTRRREGHAPNYSS